MEVILNWALRGAFWLVGLGSGIWIFRWLIGAWGRAEERWPLRIAIGMLLLAVVYGAGHYRLLADRERIEEGRHQYSRFGDPRRTELRRAEVRGWINDCRDTPQTALATYRARNGVVERTYPLGQAGANLIGGGPDADERDYTVEHLFAERLRKPLDLLESGELHPAGTDMRLTLCGDLTARAWQLLASTKLPGAVVMEDVQTGAVVAYAATGGPDDPPFGIKRYAPPGSVFKLALTALWWENNLPDDITIPCPPRIQITPRASIGNFEGEALGELQGPLEMLVPSCNTAAIWMAQYMVEHIGKQAFVDAYQRYGFETYPNAKSAPRDTTYSFWDTSSRDWARRMTPPPSRIRISQKTGPAEFAQMAIGQGPVDVTVMGVSRFIQAIGNDGVMVPPKIEWESVQQALKDKEQGRRIMSQKVALKLQTAMIAVVDRGTAASSQDYFMGTGWDLGGKTGTAQIPGRHDDGWFAGLMFDPTGHPRYTVVVYLQGGGPGGKMPAGIGGQMLHALVEHQAATAAAAKAAATPTASGGKG
jgi:cell division protein FtsI/penicillin-binding protein 2